MEGNSDSVIKTCKKVLSIGDTSSDERYATLMKLKKVPMTKEKLIKHQIHILVGKLAKNKKGKYSKRVSQLATDIRNNWKKVLMGIKVTPEEDKGENK